MSFCLFSTTSSFNLACLTNNNLKKKNLLFVNWPGSGERIVAKCVAACLPVTFRLLLFCLPPADKTQPKQIKQSLSHSACLSHCSITASLLHMEDGTWDVSMIIVQYIHPKACRLHSFQAATGPVAPNSFILSNDKLDRNNTSHRQQGEQSYSRSYTYTNTHHAATVCQKCGSSNHCSSQVIL